MARDNRLYPRAGVKWPLVLLTLEGHIFGQTLDLSPGGALIRSLEKPNLVDSFQLILKPPGRRSFLNITATRVWITTLILGNDTPVHGAGIRFTNICHDDRQFLEDRVLKHLKGRCGIADCRL